MTVTPPHAVNLRRRGSRGARHAYRCGDLLRALGLTRPQLRHQLESMEAGGEWRTWSRRDVALLAIQRCLMSIGMEASAARAVAGGVISTPTTEAQHIAPAWLVVTARRDRWIWRWPVPRLDDLAHAPPLWPAILVHPQTVVAEALVRLDAAEPQEMVLAVRPQERPATRDRGLHDTQGEG